jgi:hypothetical protein
VVPLLAFENHTASATLNELGHAPNRKANAIVKRQASWQQYRSYAERIIGCAPSDARLGLAEFADIRCRARLMSDVCGFVCGAQAHGTMGNSSRHARCNVTPIPTPEPEYHRLR